MQDVKVGLNDDFGAVALEAQQGHDATIERASDAPVRPARGTVPEHLNGRRVVCGPPDSILRWVMRRPRRRTGPGRQAHEHVAPGPVHGHRLRPAWNVRADV
jgi:hypothetical protein